MTDRINSITLIFDKDIREDDLKPMIDMLYMLKGVIKVEQNVSDFPFYEAVERAKFDLRRKILDSLT